MKKTIQNPTKKRNTVQNFNKVQKEQFLDRLYQYKVLAERTIDHVGAFLPNRMPSVTKKSIIRKNSRLIKSVDIILSDLQSHVSEFDI